MGKSSSASEHTISGVPPESMPGTLYLRITWDWNLPVYFLLAFALNAAEADISRHLEAVERLSAIWGLPLNLDKFEPQNANTGQGNNKLPHYVSSVRELGVTVKHNYETSRLCHVAAGRSRGIRTSLHRTIFCRQWKVVPALYEMFFHPLLQHSAQHLDIAAATILIARKSSSA